VTLCAWGDTSQVSPGPRTITVTVCEEAGPADRARGADRVFVTSFTFQAPGFYRRHGYRELFRWDGVPREGDADVHLRKDL
jgi:hypothetical protein